VSQFAEGALIVTVDGSHATATAGTIVRLPGGVPHALEAIEPTRMVLVVLGSPREL
jgi:quercetin dioxygenase-like cupin family protein